MVNLISIGFIVFGLLLTIIVFLFKVDGDEKKHSVARYYFKSIWYIFVVIATVLLYFTDEETQWPLVTILIGIATIEALDNFISGRKQSKNNKKLLNMGMRQTDDSSTYKKEIIKENYSYESIKELSDESTTRG